MGAGTKKAGVPFTKLHGLGNDYLYIDRFSYPSEHDWNDLSRRMAERHLGAGSDGLILVEPSDKADFRMRMFNSNGAEGDMCGNGLRCFARFVFDRGLTPKTEFEVETRAGVMRPRVNLEDGAVESISADMGVPLFKRAEVPLSELEGPEPVTSLRVESGGETYVGTALFLGNPHYVIFVDDVATVPLEKVGPGLESHPVFPRKANIEFITVKSPTELDMRVWERGSGITLACGTGACASVVAAILHGKAERGAEVTVNLPGGPLRVEWRLDGRVWQKGPAVEVYTGVFPV
jgi:diaminopimelate epimerase